MLGSTPAIALIDQLAWIAPSVLRHSTGFDIAKGREMAAAAI